MDGLSEIMAWASSGFAIASAIYTLAMGVRYDKNIKRMDERIKDFQLEEYRRKECENKKALLRAEVFHIEGNWKVSVTNYGKAQARNIRLISADLNVESGRIHIMNEDIIPYPILNTNDRFYIDLCIMESHNVKPVIRLVWDDDSGTDNSVSQALCLC